MPVGRVYQPPPKKLINPFLESDSKAPVKRNFVLPTKKKTESSVVENGSASKVELANGVNSVKSEERDPSKDGNGNEKGWAESTNIIESNNNSSQSLDLIKAEQVIEEESCEETQRIPEAVVINEVIVHDAASDNHVEIDNVEVQQFPVVVVEEIQNGSHKKGIDVQTSSRSSDDSASPPLLAPVDNLALKTRGKARLVGLASHAKGLKNLGNTCFMNSIIQCLAHTPQLLEFCQNFDEKKVKLRRAKPNSKLPTNITGTFAKLARDMWQEESGFSDRSGDPSAFKREMGSFANKFLGFDQHDSQEFLQYALEGMHNELNRAEIPEINNNTKGSERKLEPEDDPEASGLTPSEVGRRCWRQGLKREDSVVNDLFLGQFRSTLKCTVCDHESVTFEPFSVVPAPIPNQQRSGGGYGESAIKLKDCLDLYVKEETLDGDEMPTCAMCKTRTKCIKWYTFERWPKILVINLKRFATGDRFRSKLSSYIDVPVEGLDLGSFSQGLRAKYDLYGVSNHSGTLYGGHYTASCSHPVERDKWFSYNDRFVSPSSKHSIISHEAYLLFYEKRDENDENNQDTLETNFHSEPSINGKSREPSEDEDDGEEEW